MATDCPLDNDDEILRQLTERTENWRKPQRFSSSSAGDKSNHESLLDVSLEGDSLGPAMTQPAPLEESFQDEYCAEQPAEAPRRKSSRTVIILSLVAANVLILGLIFGLASRDTDTAQASGIKVTEPPVPSQANTPFIDLGNLAEEHLLELLSNSTQTAIQQDRKSPQFQAFQYLLLDPLLASYPEWRILQRFALTTFFFATDGLNWTERLRWLSSAHECEWFSQDSFGGNFDIANDGPCNGSHLHSGQVTEKGHYQNEGGRYKHLWLAANNLNGTIPFQELELLPWLESISLHSNAELQGTISSQVGKLSNLKALTLGNTKLAGPIPSEIGFLRNLTHLLLFDSGLNQTIPTELGLLEKLRVLSLYGNRMTGPVPVELGRLIALQGLLLTRNRLLGSTPTELGRLSGLEELDLSKNHLYGSIPSELGMLSNVESISVASNGVSGKIPSTFGNLPNLKTLELQENNLNRSIPDELGLLSKLSRLDLGGNQLSGSLPKSLSTTLKYLKLSDNVLMGNLRPRELPPNVTSLFLIGNALTGDIPTELAALSQLEWLALSHNNFTSAVPSELALLSNLKGLFLDNNMLTGKIPTELQQLDRLRDLWLHSNHLNGTVPTELWHNTSNLEVVFLGNNELSGLIPSEIGLLPNLLDVNLSTNRFTGVLATELGQLSHLERLDVCQNALSGPIPTHLEQLSCLVGVFLGWNKFNGSLPFAGRAQVPSDPQGPSCDGTQLEQYSVYWNDFSGSIPSELGKLTALKEVKLDGNEYIEGALPSELGMLSMLTYFTATGADLTGSIPPELGSLATVGSLATFRVTYDNFDGTVPGPLCSIPSFLLDCAKEEQCFCVCDSDCEDTTPP